MKRVLAFFYAVFMVQFSYTFDEYYVLSHQRFFKNTLHKFYGKESDHALQSREKCGCSFLTMESMLRCGPLRLSSDRTHSQALMFLQKAAHQLRIQTKVA